MLLTDVRPLGPALPFGVRIGGLTREMLNDPVRQHEIDQLFVRQGHDRV